MPMISLIANFFNSEKYIPKLIDSVIDQTYKDWELICVNDCSPMNDLQVIQKYAAKDSRIVVVNNAKNMGISKAKFEGIKHARGEYLMFIDGDDWLEPEALQRCIEPAEKYDIDMVVMSSQKVLYKGFPLYKKKSICPDCNRVIGQPELFDRFFSNFFGNNMFSVTYWGKLIRKAAFDRANLLPSPSDYSEDLLFNMRLFPHLKSMYLLDYVGYNWRWGGITSGRLKTTEKRVYKLLNFVLDMYDERMDVLNEYNYEIGKEYMTEELINYLVINLSTISESANPSQETSDLIKRYINVFKQNASYLSTSTNPALNSIQSYDVDNIYSYCHQYWKEMWAKRVLKRFVHTLVG